MVYKNYVIIRYTYDNSDNTVIKEKALYILFQSGHIDNELVFNGLFSENTELKSLSVQRIHEMGIESIPVLIKLIDSRKYRQFALDVLYSLKEQDTEPAFNSLMIVFNIKTIGKKSF